MSKKFNITPDHTIYLLIHVVIFFIGILICTVDQPIFVAIGTSISATGVTGWAIYFYIRRTGQQLSTYDQMHRMGIVTAFAARSIPIRIEYERRFNAARQQIDFCGWGLGSLREDLLQDMPRWLEHVKIRVLLLDPEAPTSEWTYARQRDMEDGFEGLAVIKNDVQKFLTKALPFKQRFPESFDVRLYNSIPSINICRIDDEMFWGPYLLVGPSRNTPTILINAAGEFFSKLNGHYDRMWTVFSRPAFLKDSAGQYVSVFG